MITLAKKIKEERDKKEKGTRGTESPKSSRISVRDKLLTKGMQAVEFCHLRKVVKTHCVRYYS